VLQCIPVSAIFNPDIFPKVLSVPSSWQIPSSPRQGCWNMMAMNLITSSINLTVDAVIFCLPIPVLIKLTMSRRKKGWRPIILSLYTCLFSSHLVNLLATYFFGLLSVIASALRISGMVLWKGESDFTYVSAIIPVRSSTILSHSAYVSCRDINRLLFRYTMLLRSILELFVVCLVFGSSCQSLSC
jgi:hypothetical protein